MVECFGFSWFTLNGSFLGLDVSLVGVEGCGGFELFVVSSVV